MLFSVIIPTYNRKELLFLTLKSVYDQTFNDFEVIVVDDGSVDGTIEELRVSFPSVTILQQQRQGPGNARNKGAANANGRYLAFLDSDDLWFPWTLAVYTEVIQIHQQPSFIAGKPFLFSSVDELTDCKQTALSCLKFPDYLASGNQWRWFGVSSFIISRQEFLQCGGFAQKWMHAEDADLALRLGTAPGFVQIQEPFTFAYLQHPGSATADQTRNQLGLLHIVATEAAGRYPGGWERAAERQRIIARHLRPFALSSLRNGNRSIAWRIFRITLPWHLREGRFRFILGFLLSALRP